MTVAPQFSREGRRYRLDDIHHMMHCGICNRAAGKITVCPLCEKVPAAGGWIDCNQPHTPLASNWRTRDQAGRPDRIPANQAADVSDCPLRAGLFDLAKSLIRRQSCSGLHCFSPLRSRTDRKEAAVTGGAERPLEHSSGGSKFPRGEALRTHSQSFAPGNVAHEPLVREKTKS
jgi:hypothetical protein